MDEISISMLIYALAQCIIFQQAGVETHFKWQRQLHVGLLVNLPNDKT